MKINSGVMRNAALAAAIVAGCVSFGPANAQRQGRQGGRSALAASGTGQSGSGQAGGCTGSQSGSATSTSTSTSASIAASRSVGVQNSNFGATAQSSSVGEVTAQRVNANTSVVQWNGSTSNVEKVYLAVLDSSGKVVSQSAVSALPARARLTVNGQAKYYGAMVVYSDGTSKTTYIKVQ